MKESDFVYMAITDDQYELPIAIAETQRELSRLVGIDVGNICRELKLQDKNIWSRFIKVPAEGTFLLPTRNAQPPKRKNKAVLGNGQYYSSIAEAAKEYSVSSSTIIYWVKTKENWRYVKNNE